MTKRNSKRKLLQWLSYTHTHTHTRERKTFSNKWKTRARREHNTSIRYVFKWCFGSKCGNGKFKSSSHVVVISFCSVYCSFLLQLLAIRWSVHVVRRIFVSYFVRWSVYFVHLLVECVCVCVLLMCSNPYRFHSHFARTICRLPIVHTFDASESKHCYEIYCDRSHAKALCIAFVRNTAGKKHNNKAAGRQGGNCAM